VTEHDGTVEILPRDDGLRGDRRVEQDRRRVDMCGASLKLRPQGAEEVVMGTEHLAALRRPHSNQLKLAAVAARELDRGGRPVVRDAGALDRRRAQAIAVRRDRDRARRPVQQPLGRGSWGDPAGMAGVHGAGHDRVGVLLGGRPV
jgi:hypothetical protein